MSIDVVWQWVTGLATIGGVTQFLIWLALGLYSAATTLRLIKLRRDRYRFTKVYFPKDVDDFVNYYANAIRSAKNRVCITSDGFNMDNRDSRRRAEKLQEAQRDFLSNGGTLIRFQIMRTTQINWIPEIAKLKRDFPDRFFTYYNPLFDDVGNFAILDPGSNNEVYEYMLPQAGYYGQATEPSDFGFIHGHRDKTEKASRKIDEIMKNEATKEITVENYLPLMRALWGERIREWERDPLRQPIDPEVMNAIISGRSKETFVFDPSKFENCEPLL